MSAQAGKDVECVAYETGFSGWGHTAASPLSSIKGGTLQHAQHGGRCWAQHDKLTRLPLSFGSLGGQAGPLRQCLAQFVLPDRSVWTILCFLANSATDLELPDPLLKFMHPQA